VSKRLETLQLEGAELGPGVGTELGLVEGTGLSEGIAIGPEGTTPGTQPINSDTHTAAKTEREINIFVSQKSFCSQSQIEMA
jgi:hypothetical protein